MLSLSGSIKGGSNSVSEYYLKEENSLLENQNETLDKTINSVGDYYIGSNELSNAKQWYGKLAESFNLTDKPLTKESFENMLNGQLGDQKVHGAFKEKRRLSHDLTFSAPKGASIMALTYGDTRIIEAWEKAVKTSLDHIEKDTAQVRKVDPFTKQTEFSNTGNLIFGLIRHQTSRENEPQLHIHAVMGNITKNDNGELQNLATSKTKSSDVLNGTYERIMKNQKFYGAVAQSHFAKSLVELGYEIKSLGNGQVDIKGIPQDVIDANSTRSKQISEYTKEIGKNSSASKTIAALKTRKSKSDIDERTLNEKWKDTNEKLGFDGKAFIDKSYQNISKKINQTEQQNIASIANSSELSASINQTMKHFSRLKSAVSYEQIVTTAISQFSNGKVLDISKVKDVLEHQIVRGDLIALDDKQTLFTSKIALEKEQALIDSTKGNAKNLSVVPNQIALKQLTLSIDNKQQLVNLLTSKKSINVLNLQHEPKQVSEALLHVASESKQNVHFITPNSFDLKSNKENTQPYSFTVMQWLKNAIKPQHVSTVNQFINAEQIKSKQPNLYIVEHANKLNIDETKGLIEKVKSNGGKLIFLNQENATKSINSNSMDLIQKGNTSTFNWSNTKITDTKLSLHEVNQSDKISTIAKNYTSLSQEQRDNLTIAATSKKETDLLNKSIRIELDRNGQLGEDRAIIKTHQSIFLSPEQKEQITSYKKGLILTEYVKGEGSKAYEIINVNKEKNKILVSQGGEKHQSISLNKLKTGSYSLSESSDLELAKGDKIRFDQSIFKTDIKAHDVSSIQRVTANSITLLTQNKEKLTLPLESLNGANASYAYALPVQKLQSNKSNLWVSMPSYQANSNILNSILNTNPKKLQIITENSKKVEIGLSKMKIQPSGIESVISAANSNNTRYVNAATSDTLKHDLNTAIDHLTDLQIPKSKLEETLQYAINQVSEKEASFTHFELLTTAINYALENKGSPLLVSDIQNGLEKLKESGNLLSSEYSDGTRWVTKESIETERYILDTVKATQNTLSPLVSQKQADEFLVKNKTLKIGQKDSIYLIATTGDRFVGVQGFAGTGKSTMLKQGTELIDAVKQIENKQPVNFVGLAPTHSAVKELTDKGIEAQTFQSLLTDFKKNGTNQSQNNTVYFLDESSMTSNNQVKTFVQFIESTTNSRAVFLGDTSQLQTQEAGKPFQLLMERSAINFTTMTNIVRQQQESLLSAVQNIIDKNPNAVIENLQKQPSLSTEQYITNSPITLTEQQSINLTQNVISKGNPHENAINDYINRTPESRENTLIIAYSNNERDLLSQMIRPELIAQGELGTENISITRLRAINTTNTDLKTMKPYKEGQVLSIFNDHYSIQSINKNENMLMLKDSNTNETKPFFPNRSNPEFTQLYEISKQPVSTGEKLVWRVTDNERGMKGNEDYTVKEINNSTMTIKSNITGIEQKLNSNDLRNSHWDYAYTKTADMAQGSTFKNVITVIDSKAPLTNIRRAYIDISRASEHVKLFTDNTSKMMNQWIKNISDKTSSLDVIDNITHKENKYFNQNQNEKLITIQDGNDQKTTFITTNLDTAKELSRNDSSLNIIYTEKQENLIHTDSSKLNSNIVLLIDKDNMDNKNYQIHAILDNLSSDQNKVSLISINSNKPDPIDDRIVSNTIEEIDNKNDAISILSNIEREHFNNKEIQLERDEISSYIVNVINSENINEMDIPKNQDTIINREDKLVIDENNKENAIEAYLDVTDKEYNLSKDNSNDDLSLDREKEIEITEREYQKGIDDLSI